jgi:hypothetical protein
VTQFQRPGVVYRSVESGKPGAVLPGCETSLVWSAANASPALARFVEFVRGD